MTRKLINDIRENLEAELLKTLNNNKKKTPVIVQKVSVSNKYLDTQKQEDVLEHMLDYYRLHNFKRETKEYIKNISRSEPDYYTLHMTNNFIDSLLTEYNIQHNIREE
jgi:hypothetical protein